MTLALIFIAVLHAVVALLAITLATRRRLAELERRGATSPLVGKTVVVNTVRPDDQAFRGIVHADHVDRITLREVIALHTSGEQAVPHVLHIDRAQISTVQEILPAREGAA